MLVLTRKPGESIRLGDGIIVTILETTGGQVKVGITAPPQLPVHREEIYLRIREENLAAAQDRSAVGDWLKGAPEDLQNIAAGTGPVGKEDPGNAH